MAQSRENKIQFHFLAGPLFLPKRRELKAFILKLLKTEGGRKAEHINYIFCSDKYLLGINKTYLKHNTLTDIITFDLSHKPTETTADIYISIERVRENSAVFGSGFRRELLRVMFHGILHLCGYKDKSASDSKLMRQKEDEYLKMWFHVEQPRIRH